MKPLVSVIVPFYNAAPYIGETLNSIILSTYRPLEVIVVDDGSTDDSFLQAQIIAKEYPEIHIYQQPNAGVSAARNHAIRKANGEWILPVDADDKISPTYIERAIDSIRDDIRVIGCRAHMFGARNGEWKLPTYSPGLLARKNMIHVSSLFRKADWELVGGFCEEDIYREDWDFWLSMMELGGEYIRLDEVGLYYRVLPHSRRSKAKSQKKAIVDAINSRHSSFLEQYLGGPLHYHRSWSRVINFFRSEKLVGNYSDWEKGEIITNGNVVALIVAGDQQADAVSAFNALFE
jgi:glycosyltransferase involved in cell wall biosynthesis